MLDWFKQRKAQKYMKLNSGVSVNNKFFKQSYHLTLIQKKILYFLLSKKPKDEFEYWCDLTEFYKNKESLNHIITRKPQIRFDFNGLTVYKRLEKQGCKLYVEFEKQFIDYIFNYDKGFTRLKLNDILKIKSLAVLNLYEILCQWEKIGTITISIDVLKQITITNGYNNYNFMMIFRRWYVKLKELIDVEYKVNNHSGTKLIKSITFKINRSQVDEKNKN